MPWHPQAPPKKLPIDLAVVDTAKGKWLIAVDTIAETEGTANLLLGIILEQNIDDESFHMRRLGVMIDAREAHDQTSVQASSTGFESGSWQPRKTASSTQLTHPVNALHHRSRA
jgi:hypothetical protein